MLRHPDVNLEQQTKLGLRRDEPVSIRPGAITLITQGPLPGDSPTPRHIPTALGGTVGMERPHGASVDDHLISQTLL